MHTGEASSRAGLAVLGRTPGRQRQQAAAEAKQIKNGKKKELDAKLKLYRAKGDSMSDKDLKQLDSHLLLVIIAISGG